MTEKAYARVVLLAVALGVVLHLPSLDAGLAADDYLQRAMLEGRYPVARSPLDLYSFVAGPEELTRLIDAGTLPWWSDPALELRALRPLASLLIALDEVVLGLSPRAQHVHSLLWFGLLISAFAGLARRIAPLGTAALAVVLFTLDPAHVMPIAWLANRTALSSAVFGVGALWAHVRSREDRWRPGAALATIGFCLAFAAGEYALSFIAYVVAYELFVGPGPWGQRLAATATALVPALAYLTLHVALGYGASGSAVYVDPIATPLKFVIAALLRIPALALSELGMIPPEALHGATAAAGLWGWLVLLALLGLACFVVQRALSATDPAFQPKLRAFGVGALASLVPLAGTLPSVRLLLVPSLGGSLMLAVLIARGLARWRSVEHRRKVSSWLFALLAIPLVIAHLGLSPIATWLGAVGWRDLHERLHRTYLAGLADEGGIAAKSVVLVNAVEPMSLISPPYVLRAQGRELDGSWRVLSITHRSERLARVSEDTLELTVEGGGMLEDPVSQLFRALEHPVEAGEKVVLSDVTIDVLELAEWGPKRVRYRFTTKLDDPSLVLLVLHRGALHRMSMLRIGEARVIPPG